MPTIGCFDDRWARWALRSKCRLGSSRYVASFRSRWLVGADAREGLLGSADIQSLADLATAFGTLRETRPVPLTRQSFVQLILIAATPMMPLVLNVIPFEELLKRAVGLLL